MATQQQVSKKERLWRGVVSHRPLRRHFEWWFQLMAIVSVPALVVCTIIIAAELSVPDLFAKGLGHLLANGAEIVLNAAIEAAMLGCIGLAKQAKHLENEPQARAMTSMGWAFAALTIITVGFQVFHASPDADKVLLLVRCAAGIVYCYVVHMDESTTEGVLNNQQHQAQLDELANRFNQQIQRLAAELSAMQETLHWRLSESSTVLARSFHEQLANELAPLQETLQQHQEVLALLPAMKAQLHQIASSTIEEVCQVKAALDSRAQTQVGEPRKRRERPMLHAVPTTQAAKFDARAFVFKCLQDDPDAKLADIEKRAATHGQELSQSSISRYRTQFFAKSESSSVVEHESSTMQAESSSMDGSMVAS